MAKIVATFVVMDGCRRRRGRGQRSALARLLLRTHGAGPGALLLEAAAGGAGAGALLLEAAAGGAGAGALLLEAAASAGGGADKNASIP